MDKYTDSKDMRESITTDAANLVTETLLDEKGKYQIRRYTRCKNFTALSPKAKVLPVRASPIRPTFYDENLGNLNDVPDKQYSDLVNHFSSLCDEENDEAVLVGNPITPSTSESNSVSTVTLQPSSYDEYLVYKKDPSTEEHVEFLTNSKSLREETNDKADLIGTAATTLVSEYNSVMKTTLQSSFHDENLGNQNELSAEQEADLAIHFNSCHEEQNAGLDLNAISVNEERDSPSTLLLEADTSGNCYKADSKTYFTNQMDLVPASTIRPTFYDENLGNLNDVPDKQYSDLVNHFNSLCDEENDEAVLVGNPITPSTSESNSVSTVTLQSSSYDENLVYKKDPSTEEHVEFLTNSKSLREETNDEADLIGTAATTLVSEYNSVMKTTLQSSFHDENLGNQNELSAEQEADLAIHFNSCHEEQNAGLDLNAISVNEERDSPSTLLLEADTSGNCYKADSKTYFTNQMDLNARKEKELTINYQNIEPDIPCYNGNEIEPTTQKSNTIISKSDPITIFATDSMDDTKFRVKSSNRILDESSEGKIECVIRLQFSNNVNVTDGYNDDMEFYRNGLSNPDTGEVKCINKGNENNELSIKGSEEIGTVFRNEIPSKNLEIASNNESKLVTSQNSGIQSCNSLDFSETETDDFKRLETRQEKNLIRTREELSTAQEIYSSNENETRRELLERISNQNMNGYLKSNFLSDTEKPIVENFISACKNYLGNEVDGDPKSNTKKDDDNDVSEEFSKSNIQSGDTLSIASNKNTPQFDSNEKFHGYKIKEVFQNKEPNKIAVFDKVFTSRGFETENTPKLKSSVSIDTEQKINQNCSKRNISNNGVEQYGVAYESEKTFLIRNVKELNKNSCSSLFLIKGAEKHTAHAYDRNNESSENFPHFESTRDPMRNELKQGEAICIASCDNFEINKMNDSSFKCTENLPVLAEDALNCNGSEPKLPTENLCQRTDIRAETFDEIKAKTEETWTKTPEINEHKPPERITTTPAGNSASPRTRVILKAKRVFKKVGKKQQGNKKEAGVILSELQESENVNRIETESSILRTSEQETPISISESFTKDIWENFTRNIRENFKDYAWENFTNRNNENEVANECVPCGEISTSEVHKESEAEAPVNSVDLNSMTRINSKNVESMKTSAQNNDSNVVLSIRDLDRNDHNKSLATTPIVSILCPDKSEELISQVIDSVSQSEVDTSVPIFKSSQEDSSTNRESKLMSAVLISSMKARSRASIHPFINETKKNTSKEKTCQVQTAENSEKGKSNQTDHKKGKSDSCDSYKQRASYKDIPAVRNVHTICNSTASFSDLNKETYISLNERKILMADSSQMCNDLEEHNEFDTSSLHVAPHSNKEVFQNTICDQDESFFDGDEKKFCIATSSLINSDNSQNCIMSPSGVYIKKKGQTKIKFTDDSVAVYDETGKQNLDSEECCHKECTVEVLRKKDKRYIYLQKVRGIVVEEASSYVSSCEKLSTISEYKPPEDITGNFNSFSANNSTSPQTSIILRPKRRIKIARKNRQGSKKNEDVTLSELMQESEVDTNASFFKPSQADSCTSREPTQMSDDLISSMKTRSQASTLPVMNETQKSTFKEKVCQNQRAENCEKGESSRKDQIKGELDNSSDSHDDGRRESCKDIPAVRNVNSNCHSTARTERSEIERYESQANYVSSCEKLSTISEYKPPEDITGNFNSFYANNSTSPQTRIILRPKRRIKIARRNRQGSKKNEDVTLSELMQESEVDTNASFFKPSQEDSCISREPTQMSDDLISSMKTRSQASIPPVMNETQKSTFKEKVRQKERAENCEKGESSRKDQIKGERDNSSDSHDDGRRESCKDIPAVRNVNSNCHSTARTERSEIERYESQASYVSSCEKLSMSQETTLLKMVDKRNGHSENARKATFNKLSEDTGFEQERETKNKDVKKWISSISSSEESSTLSERPPTGSSEDENFHLHRSTSASNSDTSENPKPYSKFSVHSSICTSLPEEEQSKYDVENFSELENTSNTLNEEENGKIKWESNLSCNRSEKSCREHIQVNDGRSATRAGLISEIIESTVAFLGPLNNVYNIFLTKLRGWCPFVSHLETPFKIFYGSRFFPSLFGKRDLSASNESLDLERESVPLNYRFKCDNLDIRFLDSNPNFTLRFVKESENQSHLVSKNLKFINTLIHSDSTDEILLLPDSSSLHNGHFSLTHPLEACEITNIGNSVQISAERLPTDQTGNVDRQNASTRYKVFSFDNPLTKRSNSQGYNESAAFKTVNEMSKLSLRHQGHNDIRPSEDEKAASASTSNGSKIKTDALDPESKNSEQSNDIIFESEMMKINYNPYSNSESISISYRRHSNASKLTFKSQEMKLYLKTSKPSADTEFE